MRRDQSDEPARRHKLDFFLPHGDIASFHGFFRPIWYSDFQLSYSPRFKSNMSAFVGPSAVMTLAKSSSSGLARD